MVQETDKKVNQNHGFGWTSLEKIGIMIHYDMLVHGMQSERKYRKLGRH